MMSGDGGGPPMENRDPNDLNSHCSAAWEDVIGEPSGAHSADCVWSLSYKCYNIGIGISYKILTFLCGVPMALCWGCYFGCMVFNIVWEVTPMIKVYTMNCININKIITMCLKGVCAPFIETCGLIFSKIVVTNRSE